MIVSSHAAHVSSTLTIITLDGGTTFSNVHIGKIWRLLQPSTEDHRSSQNNSSRPLDLVTKLFWIFLPRPNVINADVSRHYDQHQPRYRTRIRQDEMWELWADVTSEEWVWGKLKAFTFQSIRALNAFPQGLILSSSRYNNTTPTGTKILRQILGLNRQTMVKPRRHTDNAGGGKIWRRKYFYSQRAVDVTYDLLPLFYALSCILPVQHPPEPSMIPGETDPGGPLWRRRVWRNYGAGQVLTRTSCMRGAYSAPSRCLLKLTSKPIPV